MEQKVHYFAFNRGIVDARGLARADVKRMAMAAETMTNWMPRVLGSMSLRPGLGYIGSTKSDATAVMIPFVFSTTQTALIELTAADMRVWVDDELVTRPTVTAAVTNGSFDTDLTGWTDEDESGATSSWTTGGMLRLVGTGTAYAIRTQQVTVNETNVVHALRISINRGPVVFRVGSTSGGDEYIRETSLGVGTHSLAFTPTGNFHITFKSNLERRVQVSSCEVESAGAMEITTTWGASELADIRYDQSGDVVYVACDGDVQYKIERRGTESWSLVKYLPEDGPFRVENVSQITLTASVINGNGTLTASKPVFRSGHVGALFALTSIGQIVQSSLTVVDTYTDYILVEGINEGTERTFDIVITGLTGTGNTIKLQRSYGAPGAWVDVDAYSWTADATTTYVDKFDNQMVYYRLYMSVYAAGTTVCKLTYGGGSIRGITRVTSYTSSTVVNVEILSSLGGTSATAIWEEGEWSNYRGYPTAVKLHDGRLWWFGRDKIIGSVSDGFESFDHTIEGDSAPINRSIGRGPVDVINWGLAMNRLILGGQSAEYSCKSSTLDEPLTPTNFNIKIPSSQGSAPVQAVEVDSIGVYVQRSGIRVYGLAYSFETYDYQSEHLSVLAPSIGSPQITRMAVQRQPDTRIHFVRSDGTAAVLIMDKLENVNCWVEVETDGIIEEVAVLPCQNGEQEDHVYYIVRRTINGSTKRYLEKWATEDECVGGSLNLQADSYVTYSGTATTSITGLDHIEGESVVVWADGQDVGYDENDALIYTVSGGAITLDTAASNVVVGLPYTAQWKSGKLVQINTQAGTGIKNSKNIRQLGLILQNTHHRGLRFGRDFDNLDDLPSVESGYPVTEGTVHSNYDEDMIVFPGTWTIDSRICLEAAAPRPATVIAAFAEVEHHG